MVLSLSLFLGLKVNGARNQAVYPGQRHQGNSKPGYFFYDGEGALLFFFPRRIVKSSATLSRRKLQMDSSSLRSYVVGDLNP